MVDGNLEIEARFKIKGIKNLLKKLQSLGLKCNERWEGCDIFFENINGDLSRNKKILRLRLGMEDKNKGKLTFKNPYQDHILKVREEFETIVDNPIMMIKILENLEYRSSFKYEKITELWEYNEVKIYIEKLPKIGWFIEIEGAEDKIEKTAEILGFNIKKGIKKSYKEYYLDIDSDKKEWFFKNERREK